MQNITSLALPVFCPNQDTRVLPIRRTNVLPIVKLQDIWLGVDIARVFDNMTSRGSNHYRLKVHPLFSLIAYPPVTVLEKALHLDPRVTDKSLLKSR
jgi:hypothetical protein